MKDVIQLDEDKEEKAQKELEKSILRDRMAVEAKNRIPGLLCDKDKTL